MRCEIISKDMWIVKLIHPLEIITNHSLHLFEFLILECFGYGFFNNLKYYTLQQAMIYFALFKLKYFSL